MFDSGGSDPSAASKRSSDSLNTSVQPERLGRAEYLSLSFDEWI